MSMIDPRYWTIAAYALAIAVYFLPTLVANARRLKVSDGVLILNLTLGWTGLGYLGALIWSVSAQDKRPVRVRG